MTCAQERDRDGLVTGDAGIGADIEVFEIAHAGLNAIRMGKIGASVGTQPGFGAAVASFTGDAFGDFERVAPELGRNFVQGRVAGGALQVGGRVGDVETVGNLARARGGKGGERALRVKIAQ